MGEAKRRGTLEERKATAKGPWYKIREQGPTSRRKFYTVQKPMQDLLQRRLKEITRKKHQEEVEERLKAAKNPTEETNERPTTAPPTESGD
jgi:hypothetical protein